MVSEAKVVKVCHKLEKQAVEKVSTLFNLNITQSEWNLMPRSVKHYFMVQYLNHLYDRNDDEYFYEDGKPKMCSHCKNKEFVASREHEVYTDDKGVVECIIVCSECQKPAALWSYGQYFQVDENEV